MYLAFNGQGLFWSGDETRKESKEIPFPVYIGIVAITYDDFLVFFPDSEQFSFSFEVERRINKIIEEPNGLIGNKGNDWIKLASTSYFKAKASLFIRFYFLHEAEYGQMITYAAARRKSQYFNQFVERRLFEDGFWAFRKEYNAKPDLSWKPKFKTHYSYAEFRAAPLETFKLFSKPMGVEENVKILLEYE
jgi:hypothetical protein